RRLGTSENEVLARLARLKDEGAISRIGAVVRPNTIGVSTLAAMAVPAERLEEIAQIVNSYAEVNHNYEREHNLNLWFVATAADSGHLQQVLSDIQARCSIEVLPFPLVEDYHIDLGFELKS
ncbi:MAG: Lrp/AsnC family transcriptional regulator, partial [Gammaproteobacteria bacterium]|nr:Lrp/AsnC family transcriptional regulator [Gammaproteobacteria bacterium]